MALLDLHSGGVVRNGFASLLVGTNGAGKSTLVTLLLSRGFSFLSDDNTRLDSTSWKAHPSSRSIFLREDAHDHLPGSIRRYLIRRANGVWQFDDAQLERFRCWDPKPVKAVVLLNPRREEITELAPVGQLEALTELLRQCRSLNEMGPPVVPVLAELVKDSLLFRLTSGDLNCAVELLHDHLP